MIFTVGHYLAERLTQIGLKHHFAVTGDCNLVLLDQLLAHGGMKQIYSCNELNCSLSAEGYARVNGAAAAVITFGADAISALNGIREAYAENLPVILISGTPNTRDPRSDLAPLRQIGMVRHITVAAEIITSAETAPAQIDHVIRTALREKKPAYLEIACHIADQPCVRPSPVSSLCSHPTSDLESLNAAVDESLCFLEKRNRIVILVGSKLPAVEALENTTELADGLGCSITVVSAAKSLFPEEHPAFQSIYWDEVSNPRTEKIIHEADGIITLAPVWNDYSSVGWQNLIHGENVLEINPDRVTVNNRTFNGFCLKDFVREIAHRSQGRPASSKEDYQPWFFPLTTPMTNDETTRQSNIRRRSFPRETQAEDEMSWQPQPLMATTSS